MSHFFKLICVTLLLLVAIPSFSEQNCAYYQQMAQRDRAAAQKNRSSANQVSMIQSQAQLLLQAAQAQENTARQYDQKYANCIGQSGSGLGSPNLGGGANNPAAAIQQFGNLLQSLSQQQELQRQQQVERADANAQQYIQDAEQRSALRRQEYLNRKQDGQQNYANRLNDQIEAEIAKQKINELIDSEVSQTAKLDIPAKSFPSEVPVTTAYNEYPPYQSNTKTIDEVLKQLDEQLGDISKTSDSSQSLESKVKEMMYQAEEDSGQSASPKNVLGIAVNAAKEESENIWNKFDPETQADLTTIGSYVKERTIPSPPEELRKATSLVQDVSTAMNSNTGDGMVAAGRLLGRQTTSEDTAENIQSTTRFGGGATDRVGRNIDEFNGTASSPTSNEQWLNKFEESNPGTVLKVLPKPFRRVAEAVEEKLESAKSVADVAKSAYNIAGNVLKAGDDAMKPAYRRFNNLVEQVFGPSHILDDGIHEIE